MAKYYPKSQIKTNLYTEGNEYVLSSTNKKYKGYYYKISTGEVFSGQTPEYELTERLLPIFISEGFVWEDDQPSNRFLLSPEYKPQNTPNLKYSNVVNSVYNFINPPSKLKYLLPVYNPALPTENDYRIGKFTRYFCKKTNELLYIEINKDTYLNLIKKNSEYLWQLYLPFELPWQLTGDIEKVKTTNSNVTKLIQQRLNLTNFNLYLKEDYLKYYLET